ncbi:MAG: DUF3795 domain-containing protein [Methanomassiliicoccaceae archaeon]|nr:DUF3795 domain-containing protein [Methanomassiliicoccaceae archaeon]
MDKRYMCYCGLYCENCAVKARVEPAARVLYKEMRDAGFEEVIDAIPGGGGFWPFLKGMAEDGACTSCKDRGGHPGCAIRICAMEKKVEMCALCGSYPCEKIAGFLERLPFVKIDNDLLRTEGIDAWSKVQDERKAKGFAHTDGQKKQ